VIVGDFAVEDARALVADTFGRVPRGADVPRPAPAATEPTRVRVETQDRLPTADVGILFSGPAYGARENGALAIAAELLGNVEYGQLRNRLVATGLATSTYAEWYPGYLAGRFYLDAVAADGVDAEKIEAALREAFAEFAAEPLDAADVERARRTILQARRVAREPLRDRAEAIGEMTEMLDRPELAFADDPNVATATVAEVEAALRTILRLDDATTLVIRPGERGDYPPLLTESTGAGAPFTAAEKPAVTIPRLAALAPRPAMAPAVDQVSLGSGAMLRHYHMPDAPLAHVAVVAPAGWSSAPAGKEGLFDLAATMAVRGAGERDYAAFAKAASDISARFGTRAEQQATMLTLSVPPEALAQGAAMLAQAVRAPRFDPAEWDVLKAEAADWLARREADLPDVAYRAGKRVLIPRQPGMPDFDWSAEALDAIALDDAKQAFGTLFRQGGVSFISVGPGTAAEVGATLDQAFLSVAMSGKAAPAPERAAAEFPQKRRVVLLPEPGASQTAIMVARPAPGLDEEGRSESEAVMRLLGDDFTSRLNSVIREEKGFSYGVYGHLMGGIRRGSALVIQTTVERDNTGPALAEYFKGFDSLVSRPVEQTELDRTITAYQRTLAGIAETSGGLFDRVIALAGETLSLEQGYAQMEAVTRLVLEPVRARAQALSSLERGLVVLAGDPDVVLPQLAALGIADVEVLEREVSRDAVEAMTEPPLVAGRRDGSTRSVHRCEGQEQAGCQAHSH
jgi:predicted Zn-dependent peptidase